MNTLCAPLRGQIDDPYIPAQLALGRGGRAERRRRAGPLGLLFAAALGAQGSMAGAQEYLGKMGGVGGGPFDARCPANQTLAGLELRAGLDIDAVRPLCVTAFGARDISQPSLTGGSGVTPVAGGFGMKQVSPGWYGGSGGQIVRLLCPPGAPIVRGLEVDLEGDDAQIVNAVRLYCGPASTQQVDSSNPSAIFEAPISRDEKSYRKRRERQHCPVGQVAAGIHGRSGEWLDALGLSCAQPRIDAPRQPPKILGRVQDGESILSVTICESARMARARNSPAASGLDARCRAQQAGPIKVLGRVHSANPTPSTLPICESAKAALARNSPAARGLEARCQAQEAKARANEDAAAAAEPLADGEPIAPQPEPDPRER
jgi:hypothetical protein